MEPEFRRLKPLFVFPPTSVEGGLPNVSGGLRDSVRQILSHLACGELLSTHVWQQLEAWELADERRAKAFGIVPKNVGSVIQARSRLFQAVAPELPCSPAPLLPCSPTPLLETLWHLWLPLGMRLAAHRQTLGRPLIQGILGSQGTGKTTLARILILILRHLGYRTLSLSLDDLYKTYAERLRLREEDPRLVWRGPPGTHDVKLGLEVLDRLRQHDGEPIQVPRFDKSAWGGAGDRTESELVEGADIVLFEGWFVGVRPIISIPVSIPVSIPERDLYIAAPTPLDIVAQVGVERVLHPNENRYNPSAFDTAPDPILTEEDRSFARDCNAKLRDYLPLWERLDSLIVLYPVDYRLSLVWRQQAEQEMRAAGKSGMSDSEIVQFVKYFWKALHPELFIAPLVNNPHWVDLAIAINPDHSPCAIYRP